MKFTPVYAYKTKDYSLHKLHLGGRTQTLTFRTHTSGNKLRFLLTNKYSPHAVKVRNLSAIINGRTYSITVDGKSSFKLSAYDEKYTDAVAIDHNQINAIVAKASFPMFTHFHAASDFNSTKIASVEHKGILHRNVNLGIATKTISKPHLQIVTLIKQVEVFNDNKTIAWFGDSLTNHSYYTQPLQERIYDAKQSITLVNVGHSGNRLLRDGEMLYKHDFGISGLKRFEEEVFKYNKPELVVIAIGVNDLIHPGRTVARNQLPTLDSMIDGYRELLKTIRKYAAKGIICTITPFKGYSNVVLEEAEQLRLEINEWIRNQSEFDDVIDLCKLVTDKSDEAQLAVEFRGDDNLHWDQKGGQIIANSIDLNQLLKHIK